MMGQIKHTVRFYPGLLTALNSVWLFAAIPIGRGLAQEGVTADAPSLRQVESTQNHIPAFMED